MKYHWDWVMCDRESIGHICKELEDGGHEVFAIVPVEFPPHFVMIVNRKPR